MPKDRTILITGVCGCIGSHLLDELMARGEKVVGVDDLSYGKMANVRTHLGNKNFRFHKLDITDFQKFKRKVGRVDVILHMASLKKGGEDMPSWPTLKMNTRATESALELAKLYKARIIIASTSDVYGVSEKIPFREDGEMAMGAPTAKRWAYAVSKIYSEQLAMSYYKDFGVPAVILRYFGVFSERSSRGWSGGHVPIFTDLILKDKAITIHGDGSQTRSMGYVADVVSGTLLAMEKKAAVGEVINIGNHEELTVLETAKLIHKLAGTGKKLKIKFIPMKKVFGTYREIPRRRPDLSKAKRLLGYTSSVSFREGLRRVIDCWTQP